MLMEQVLLKGISFITFLFLSITPVVGQTVPTHRYTTADGLVSDRVTSVTQDKSGFIWVGTYFGLSRYDGYHFQTISLPDVQKNKYVSALLATNDALYAGFLFGGGLMEFRQGRATAYSLPIKDNVDNDIYLLSRHTGRGILLVSSSHIVYHFVDGRFKQLFKLDSTFRDVSMTSLAMDKDDNIWLGTDKGLIMYTKSGKLINVSPDATVYLQPSGRGVVAIFAKRYQYILVNIEAPDAASLVRKAKWKGEAFRQVPQENVQSGQFWLEDTSGRFIHLGADGNTSALSIEGIVADDVQHLYSDRENNLWIATHTGLVKIANLPARFYGYGEIAYGTGDIVGNDSAIWVANGKHLYSIRNNNIERLRGFNEPANYPTKLLLTDSELWVGQLTTGVWRLGLKNNDIISRQLYEKAQGVKIRVHEIVKDEDGNVWITGENGIFILKDGKAIARFQPLLQNGNSAFIICLAIDTKRRIVWAGDNSEGILQIKYELTQNGANFKVIRYIGADKGLTDGYIRSMLLDSKGMLWAGTRFGGIFRIKDNESDIEVHNLSAKAGLQCTRVTDIKEMDGKQIWLSTCNGVYRYTYDTERWQAFTTAEGLHSGEVFSSYVSPAQDKCWSASELGITAFRISAKTKLPPPLINITGVHVLGKQDSLAVTRQQARDYAPDENSIGFEFAAASYTDEKRILYKYMLQGYDNEWSVPARANSIDYASLPAGKYVFKVIASAGNDEWSVEPASFSFTITRPFYKSPWFAALLAALLVAGIYFFRMYQLSQKLKLERVRSRISSDLHDDIGSTLSSISIISEGAIKENNPAAAKEMIKEINDNAVWILDKMDDIIWCVNPKNDSFTHFMLRIRKFAATLFEAKGIEYDIDIDESIPNNPLSMASRQHMYLILKEAINNLVKYSGASYASVNMQLNANFLDIIVKDNGKGFDIDEVRRGNGLYNMKRRASMLNAVLNIESSEKGTVVFLRTKIK
jgi:signal transduction histidine kinase/ligand-binding sensor domain-containing protein